MWIPPLAGQTGIAAAMWEDVQPYVPQLLGTVTDPSLGTGSTLVQEGFWWRWGPMVQVTVRLRFGTSGVSNGAGSYRVTLPVAASSIYTGTGTTATGSIVGNAALRDNSPFAAALGMMQFTNPSTVLIIAEGQQVGADSPWTWAASDAIGFTVTYVVDPS